MQRDAVYLSDILSAAADLGEFARSATFEDFCANKPVRYAMLHALTVVGEASSKVSTELKERYAAVPWKRISSVRHRIVHDYSGLDYELLWQVVTAFVPDLETKVAAIFRAEFPGLAAGWPNTGESPKIT